MTAFVIPNAILITTRQAKYNFASFLSRDTTYDVIHNIWRLVRPPLEDSASIVSAGSGGGGSFEGSIVNIAGQPIANGAGAERGLPKKVTQCACGKAGQHFTETAMEVVFPGTPERIHNLMFASGFMKDFMAVNQKLMGES